MPEPIDGASEALVNHCERSALRVPEEGNIGLSPERKQPQETIPWSPSLIISGLFACGQLTVRVEHEKEVGVETHR